MLYKEGNIVRVEPLDRLKDEAEAETKERLDEGFSAEIRARMEAER